MKKISARRIRWMAYFAILVLGVFDTATAGTNNVLSSDVVGGEVVCQTANCIKVDTNSSTSTTVITNPFTTTKTETQTALSSRTVTSTGTTVVTSTATERTVESGVTELYEIGASALYSGTEKIALGITLLSQSRSKNSEEISPEAQDALRLIGAGNDEVAKGQASIKHGRAIEEKSLRMGQAERELSHAIHSPVDFNQAPSSLHATLAKMESKAEVSPSALLDAVKDANTEAVYDLASSAKDVGLSGEQISAEIPIYYVSSKPASSSPDVSKTKEAPMVSAQPKVATKATPIGVQSEVGVPKVPVPQRTLSSVDPLAPLERNQFLSTFSDLGQANWPFGNSSVSLFQRVRAQYLKRR